VAAILPPVSRIGGDLAELARRYGLELVLAFGSAVTGRLHARSDTDVAVLRRRPLSMSEELDLQAELQRVFPERPVDVAFLDRADPLFLKKVLESAVLLHGSATRLAELRIYSWKRSVEHEPYLALERRYVRRFLADRAS
jgi:predicted nucleotidyltransferase